MRGPGGRGGARTGRFLALPPAGERGPIGPERGAGGGGGLAGRRLRAEGHQAGEAEGGGGCQGQGLAYAD
jgi:hypothetical protein